MVWYVASIFNNGELEMKREYEEKPSLDYIQVLVVEERKINGVVLAQKEYSLKIKQISPLLVTSRQLCLSPVNWEGKGLFLLIRS